MTTKEGKKTETKEQTVESELVGQRAPLALVTPEKPPPPGAAGYLPFAAPVMTEERKQFLKRQFCPAGCRDVDFEFFVAYCERTGLDPVLKQAYLVERNMKVKTRRPDGRGWDETWITKFDPMTAEAGMAAKADALPDYQGIKDGVVYEGDVFEIDYAAGVVVHKASPLKRGKIVGAWAHVQRKDRAVPITWLRVEERVQTKGSGDEEKSPTFFWSKMTASQILKCARAEQWRQAYPNLFGGQYVPEEVRDEREELDVTPANEAATAAAARDTTDRLMDHAKKVKDAEGEKKPEAKDEKKPAAQRTVDVTATRPSEATRGEAEAAKRNAALKAEIDPVVEWCEKNGHPYDGEKLIFDEAYRKAKVAEVTELQKKAATPGTASPPAEPEKREHRTTDKLPHEVADEKKAAEGPLMNFGPHKGKPIGTLDGPTLLEQIAFGESKIGELDEVRAKKVRACLEEMRALQKRREAALLDDPPEPGSDLDVD